MERIFPVASPLEKQEFSYILSKKTSHSFSDGYFWFSIFSRSPSNLFTRVQRCTCCFVLLFLSMFLNILYYDSLNDTQMNNSINRFCLSLGPLILTRQQVCCFI